MNKDRLIQTLSVQSASYDQWRMFAYIIRQLEEIGCDYHVHEGNVYATKGKADIYPCIVSHMDTVHAITSDLTILQVGEKYAGFNRIKMQQTGIGGDDKVGIFIALECLRHFSNIKSVFFRDEEVGCEGSYEAKMEFFEDCGFVLQCDRQGNSDFIDNAGFVELCSKAFKKDIKWIIRKHGYKFDKGMMTDVMALKENGLECCAANMSCGYYSPHTSYEYVNVKDVENCLDMVKEIIGHLGHKQYYHTHKVKSYKTASDKYFDALTYGYDQGRLARSNFHTDKYYCECCCETSGKTIHIPEFQMDLCEKCIRNHATNPERYLDTSFK